MEPRVCPNCSQALAPDAPHGLCPECLLKAAFRGESQLSVAPDNSSPTGGWQGASGGQETISPATGMRLRYFGDYELLEEIARGGMGIVWKARQSSLNRVVALKTIRSGALAGPDEVQRFLREAEAAANLQHPNIVAIHEVGEFEGQHYFSMDYVAGRDLGVLVQAGPLPARRAARYVQIIAEAIHFAHQRGTLHRDLKPQNVLIDEADQPRITDFGLAKRAEHDSRLTQTGVVMGSPSYMSPEQAAGHHDQVGPASDVYSLGAVLYELLTARPPFQAATPLATLRATIDSDPLPPSRVTSDVPTDLETICLKCLDKSPTARYPSARALAEDLGRFLSGEPIQARRASLARQTSTWIRKHPGTLAALAALLIVGLVFGSFYLIEENRFLRAQQATPGLERVPGARGEALTLWYTLTSIAQLIAVFTVVLSGANWRGVAVKDIFDPTRVHQPPTLLGSGQQVLVAGIGLATIACGIMLLVKMIQVQVWEGSPLTGSYLAAFPAIWFGLFLIHRALRDYHRAIEGVISRSLATDQIDSIRQRLEEFDLRGAIRDYREAAPDASSAEARDYVWRLYAKLHAQQPDKFRPPALSLKTLNWRAAALCAAIEAAGFALLWFTLGVPGSKAATIYWFASGLVWGVCVMAATRVRGLWKRLVVIAPAIVMMVAGGEIVASLSGGPWMAGILCGVFLMMSAFTRRKAKGERN